MNTFFLALATILFGSIVGLYWFLVETKFVPAIIERLNEGETKEETGRGLS